MYEWNKSAAKLEMSKKLAWMIVENQLSVLPLIIPPVVLVDQMREVLLYALHHGLSPNTELQLQRELLEYLKDDPELLELAMQKGGKIQDMNFLHFLLSVNNSQSVQVLLPYIPKDTELIQTGQYVLNCVKNRKSIRLCVESVGIDPLMTFENGNTMLHLFLKCDTWCPF